MFKLRSSGLSLPKAYGLPKIYKDHCPFRIIISSVNTPLYRFAFFLHKIISDNIPPPNSHVNNSFDLCRDLSDLKLPDSHILISLDVVSLFTNIPLDLALDSVSDRWRFIENKSAIPKKEFLSALRFVLSSTFFSFNNATYKQTFGTPMGSPLSPIIADIVMCDLEEYCLRSVNVRPSFYYRYVDDIVLAENIPSVSLVYP